MSIIDIHNLTQEVTGLARPLAKVFLYSWIFNPDTVHPVGNIPEAQIRVWRRKLSTHPEFHKTLFTIIQRIDKDIDEAVRVLGRENGLPR